MAEISKKIRDPATGGASVTIPHKLAVIPLVDKLTEHSKQIGNVIMCALIVEYFMMYFRSGKYCLQNSH